MRDRLTRWLPLAAAIASLAIPALASGEANELIGVININTATAAQLEQLPGVGEAIASRIVAARAKKPFAHTWEITRVKGIGPKTFRKLKDRLTVSGPTTLRASRPAPSPRRSPSRSHGGSRRRRSDGPRIIEFPLPSRRTPPTTPPLDRE